MSHVPNSSMSTNSSGDVDDDSSNIDMNIINRESSSHSNNHILNSTNSNELENNSAYGHAVRILIEEHRNLSVIKFSIDQNANEVGIFIPCSNFCQRNTMVMKMILFVRSSFLNT